MVYGLMWRRSYDPYVLARLNELWGSPRWSVCVCLSARVCVCGWKQSFDVVGGKCGQAIRLEYSLQLHSL